MTNLIPFPRAPHRAIYLRPVQGEAGHWQAVFDGDEFTENFLTPPAPKAAILLAFGAGDIRLGLPLVVIDEPEPLHGQWTPEGELVA